MSTGAGGGRRKSIRKLSFLGFNTGADLTVDPSDGEPPVQLDDEMDKVFAMADGPERLDVSRLAGDEPDLDQNRKRSYGGQSGGLRRRSRLDSEFSLDHHDKETSEPLVSERAASQTDSSYESPGDKRVQFEGSREEDAPVTQTEDQEPRSQRNSRHHHHKGRKYSLQEEPRWKQRAGSEIVAGAQSSGMGRRVSVQPEDETLAEADLEELDSHRSDDPKALRRPKIQSKISAAGSTVHIGRKDGADKLQSLLPAATLKKMYDHSPHAVFVQLDELLGGENGQEQEWKETARWIKYEEDVEEGSARWGRPHVASLSFHSLLNLRRCLETGVVLMDLDEKDLPGVAYRVVEQMVVDELIEEDDKPVVMRSLLLRHRHVNEHDRGFRFSISGRKHSSYTSLQSLWVEDGAGGGAPRCSICSAGIGSPTCRRHSAHPINLSDQRSRIIPSSTIALDNLSKNGSTVDIKSKLGHLRDSAHHIDMREEIYTASQEDLKKSHNESIMKRIPGGAEATTVLVGSVGFLDQPTIAFVRLAQGILMPGITEVPIPVRFMFILLGPSSADLDYHEVGRSISTLMSNPSFHKIAYKADDRRDLLSAINEFLDDSIVLPPGDWERQALLPFEELKAKSDMIRRRKREALEKKHAAAAAAAGVQLITSDEQKRALLEAEGLPYKPPKVNPLEKTGRIFGGLINDAKRRYPLYLSDIMDGLNGQCVAAAIFMYFAALSSAITFGGLYAEKTGHQIGISETLVFTSVAGIIFAILAGQPMMVVGSTGPLLLFDTSLYMFCKSNGFDFLVARVYMGIWNGVIAIIVASIEGSVMVKRFTRFTEDIFASLISLIFIIEPVTNLIMVYQMHPLQGFYSNTPATDESIVNITNALNGTVGNLTDLNTTTTLVPDFHKPVIEPKPNTALFCTALTLGTFTIAYYLRIFRNSKFLGRSARRALGDFGVPIAIILMVLFDYLVPDTYTEKLSVPEGLSPTDADRSWFVLASPDAKNLPVWAIFAMAIPALMVYIIVFMETHIAELIVDKPERNLQKGSGFHMDIVLISLINTLCGLMGAPWMCVATVRSVSHVSALTVMSTTHAPGDKPHIIEVKEQRLSALLVSILVGASVGMAVFLRLVPMSVLFGVFLYMGISSINGIQMFDRLILLFMPVKHHPQVPYVRRVPTLKMHLFTIIQLMCLATLWTIKSTRASLAFPFFLILMVPLRAQLTHFFTPLELRALDGKQPDADKDDEPDFYEEAPLPG